MTKYVQYINNAILFLKFTALLILVAKLANFTDITSLFNDVMKAKEFFFATDGEDLQELILEEENFPEMVEVEVPSSPEKSLSLDSESQNNKYLYTVLKIGGAIICVAAISFGVYYCINYFGNNVTTVADVATKGLDESTKAAITKSNEIALEILDKNKEILEARKTELIKEIPKIKPREFYIPPKR